MTAGKLRPPRTNDPREIAAWRRMQGDDHVQYLLANGTRTLTGNMAVGALVTIDGRDLSVDGSKLDGIEALAEVNNISDVNATDLTDGGDTTLHDHDGITENTAARHTQGTDTDLGVLGTKNPPIDADKVIQRDSADSDVVKTSTWTQVKAFLKTYFDTLYNNYSLEAHKDTHDPFDGSDPLDTANAAEISTVVAAGTGTSHSLSRADHVHAINHSIADNHLVTIDGTTNQPVSTDYAKFTANGLEGRSASEVMGDLSGGAAAAFSFNGQNLTSVGTIALNGGQIAFPAIAVPSADPNTLDDYEEGMFTPTILLGGTPVTSYYYQYGYYTKIGDRMFFNLFVIVNVVGAGTGAVTIGGLPGTSLSNTKSDSSVSVHADYLTGLAGQHLSGIIYPSTSSIVLYYLLNTRAVALPHTIMDAADTSFEISGHYMSVHPA